MSDHSSHIDHPSPHEFVTTRRFDAPCEEVFRAFSDPARLAQWWGPQGFTNTFKQFDLRPGGTWRFVMHGPDGAQYEMNKRFIEVVEPARIVLRHEQADHSFTQTMTYTASGTGTILTWRMRFESAEEAERLRPFIPNANEQNFDRLQDHLRTAAKETQP